MDGAGLGNDARMKVSSPDKVLFPPTADGAAITKAEVVAHYERVGEAMIPIVAGRPLTLQRFPKGIDAKGFMQKNAADHFPDSIRRFAVPKRDGDETCYPVIDRAEDLAWLANQNTVTFHVWTSSVDRPERPDWLVLDLDPEAGDVDGARRATLVVREVLGRFGLDGSLMATGSKGFHVWVPLDGDLDFDWVGPAARALAGLAALAEPDALTTEFLKKERRGRVFVDWLRNGQAATVVAPFSLRPRPGAPVAVPITWDELPDAEPDGRRIGDLDDRMSIPLPARGGTLPVDEIVDAARSAGVDLDTPHDRFGRRR